MVEQVLRERPDIVFFIRSTTVAMVDSVKTLAAASIPASWSAI